MYRMPWGTEKNNTDVGTALYFSPSRKKLEESHTEQFFYKNSTILVMLKSLAEDIAWTQDGTEAKLLRGNLPSFGFLQSIPDPSHKQKSFNL